MKVLFTSILLSLTITSLAQTVKLSYLSPEETQQDFSVFKKVLLEAHPSPYRFTYQEDFEKLFDQYETLINDPIDQLSFFQIISSLMSNVGEGHSTIDISESMRQWMQTESRLLPFSVHFYEQRAFIKKDQSNFESRLEGYEILEINGMKLNDIMQRIDSISCLGTSVNPSLMYRKLSLLQNFPLAYFLHVDQRTEFNLVLLDLDGQRNSIQVPGIRPDFEVLFTQELDEQYPPYTIDIDTARDLAIIKITTFAHWVLDLKFKDYEKFYQVAFDVIDEANIQNLVIDVRNNRGGHEYLGAELLTYLIPYPFRLETSIFSKGVKYPVLDSLGIDYGGLGERAFKEIDSGYVVKESIVLGVQQPNTKTPFSGNVYFLTNGNCFSACNIFMALADYHEAGTIIGEETGGIYQDTDGYFRLNYELPNSGLKISFPLWHIKTAVERDHYGRGVFPDIQIQPKIEDVIGKRDVMLDKVYELIKQNQKID